MHNFKIVHFFPLFITDPMKLGTEKASDQKSSLLSNLLAEWCLVLHQLGSYDSFREFLERDIPHLNNQLWVPDKKVEEFLYSCDASRKSGKGITTQLSVLSCFL